MGQPYSRDPPRDDDDEADEEAAAAAEVHAARGAGDGARYNALSPQRHASLLSRADRARARAEEDDADSSFPSIPPSTTLRGLLADGLRPDLSFCPFQMPRLGGAWEEAVAEAARRRGDDAAAAFAAPKEREAIRCRNSLKLKRDSLKLNALVGGSVVAVSPEPQPTIAQMPSANSAAPSAAVQRNAANSSAPPLPPKPQPGVPAPTRYGLAFDFECLVPCSGQVRWLVNEIEHGAGGDSTFVQNAAAAAIPAAAVPPSSSSSAAAPAAAPLVPPQFFAAGTHHFELPLEYALDTSHLAELQLHHSARLRYFPLVIQLSETKGSAAGRAQGGESKEQLELGRSASSAASSAASLSSAQHVRSLTVYCALTRRPATGVLTVKLLRQSVTLAPSGQRFNIQEVYAGAGDEGKEGSTTTAAPSSADAAGAPATRVSMSECVVCLVESPSTAILPCRHMCLCADCARVVQQQHPPKCPVCRAHVEATVRVTVPAPEGAVAAQTST